MVDEKPSHSYPLFCRLCASTDTEAVSILSTEGRMEDLTLRVERMENWAGIQPWPKDLLPEMVCSLCRKQLQTISNFIEKVVEAHHRILAMLGQLQEEGEGFLLSNKGNIGKTEIQLEKEDKNLLEDEQEEEEEEEREEDEEDEMVRKKKRKKKVKAMRSGRVRMLGGEAVTVCSKCGERSRYHRDLVEHWKTFHPGCDIVYVCREPGCHHQSQDLQDMREHIRRHLFLAGEISQCQVCSKYFPDSHLNTHIRNVHQGVRPHPCRFCDKSFQTSGNLRTHLKIHGREDEKYTFSCHLCGKRFTQKGGLDNHLMLHSGLKPYKCDFNGCDKCDECGAKYTSNSHLRAHINNKHRGIQRFHCQLCPNKYNRPDQFRKHQMVHTGETPWKCNSCGKGFRRKDTLKKHEVVHYADEEKYKYPCKLCEKSFTQAGNLNTHMKNHHAN